MILRNIALILIFCLPLSAHAKSFKNIIIQGNDNIDKEVIYSIIGDNVFLDQNYDKNIIIKKLYATGNFNNVEIIENNDDVIIKIIENPKITKFSFIGNKRFKNDEILAQFNEDEYFIYINRLKLDKFVEDLKALYMSFGYNQIAIQYEIIKDNDFVNSAFFKF